MLNFSVTKVTALFRLKINIVSQNYKEMLGKRRENLCEDTGCWYSMFHI